MMSGNTLAHRAMRLVGFVSNVTSKMLRAAGAVFSPAEKLADGLDFALIKTGLYKTQTASHLVLSALPQCLRPQTLLGDKYDLFASLGWVAFPLGCLCAAWSGVCLFTAFACVFLFPMAGILALPAISITIAGCTVLRIMIAVKDVFLDLVAELKAVARIWLVSWADSNLTQHANQIRFLLGELPRGQSLPTIAEEDEEELREHEHDYTSALYASAGSNITNLADTSAKDEAVKLSSNNAVAITATTAAQQSGKVGSSKCV